MNAHSDAQLTAEESDFADVARGQPDSDRNAFFLRGFTAEGDLCYLALEKDRDAGPFAGIASEHGGFRHMRAVLERLVMAGKEEIVAKQEGLAEDLRLEELREKAL